MRLMEETKEESRERRQSAQDRKLRRERFMVKPDATRLNFEKRLRKVATQGSASRTRGGGACTPPPLTPAGLLAVVQLFNSVRQHQQALKHAGADRAGVAAPHKQSARHLASAPSPPHRPVTIGPAPHSVPTRACAEEVRKVQNENFLRMLREATGASKRGGEGARDEGAVAAGGKAGNKAAGKADGTAPKARWAVLDENLMLGSSSMRAWDRDEHVAKEVTQRRARGRKGRGGGGGGDDDIFVQDRAGDAGASKIAWSDDED